MKNLLLFLLKATDLIGKCTKSFPESDEVNYELFIYFLISIIEMIFRKALLVLTEYKR